MNCAHKNTADYQFILYSDADRRDSQAIQNRTIWVHLCLFFRISSQNRLFFFSLAYLGVRNRGILAGIGANQTDHLIDYILLMFTLLQRFHSELEEFAATGVGYKHSAAPNLQISFCNFVCNRLPDAKLGSKDMVTNSRLESSASVFSWKLILRLSSPFNGGTYRFGYVTTDKGTDYLEPRAACGVWFWRMHLKRLVLHKAASREYGSFVV